MNLSMSLQSIKDNQHQSCEINQDELIFNWSPCQLKTSFVDNDVFLRENQEYYKVFDQEAVSLFNKEPISYVTDQNKSQKNLLGQNKILPNLRRESSQELSEIHQENVPGF